MEDSTKTAIKILLLDIVTNTITRTRANLIGDKKPFHKSLLGEVVVKLSSFERSFSTSFGQKYVEEISKIIVSDQGLTTERQKAINAPIFQGANDEIESIIESLKSNKTKPNWTREVADVQAHNKGVTTLRKVISDLWFKRDGIDHFVSIKTVKPNLDQTKTAKQDMLILKANDPKCMVYFALYYNPTGTTQKEYTYSIPNKYFDMKNDPCVLIGEGYWDFLGGTGTYGELLDIFDEVGKTTIDQVKNMKL